ncbi:bone morphogenetic protein 2-like [Hyperolius riggenbachi]|uniref:bone morphogenetic protein 2-like n=1 Tax=Hyperolius riggenbachi TaxID=752182 RepID=UPI0035A3D0F5
MDVLLIIFLIVLLCGPSSFFHLSLERKSHLRESVPVSEAIQKLQEVFAFAELPHNITPEKKPPQFMLELYSRVAGPDGSTKAHGLLEGNIVRSFENKVLSEKRYPVYIFNISSVRSKEHILKAEFRVLFKWRLFALSAKFHYCRVDVYELLDGASGPWRGNLISSRLLPLHSQGWEMFNVTQTVSKWAGDGRTDHGFLLTFTLPSGSFLDIDLHTFQKHNSDSNKSYLVLFNDDGRRAVPNTNTAPTYVKDTESPLPESEDSYLLQPMSHKLPHEMDHARSRRTRDAYPARYPACHREPLYVDFEDIGWAGWIISPKGYNAYHCKGICMFPMGKGLGATNHATVQSIVHALKLKQGIETPCCVPNQLNSINLLYFDDEENVVLKQYDDMVAVSCGCH